MNPRVVDANLVLSIKSFYRAKSTMFFTIAFPIILILAFAFAGIGMILTRFAKEAESAAAANAISFPLMFLSGSFFPLEMMPGFMQTVGRILPLYYVNEGLRGHPWYLATT